MHAPGEQVLARCRFRNCEEQQLQVQELRGTTVVGGKMFIHALVWKAYVPIHLHLCENTLHENTRGSIVECSGVSCSWGLIRCPISGHAYDD